MTMINTNPTLFMETGVAAVAAVASPTPGWVSGNPASLALSASVNCIFDLGPKWDQYSIVNVGISPVGPSSGFSNISIASSATAALDSSRRLGYAFAAAAGNVLIASATVAAGAIQAVVRPLGRYLVVSVTNADGVNALGATAKVAVGAYVA